MKRLPALALLAAAAFTVIIGCGKNGAGDDALANDVKAKLYSDPATKAANINVAVKNGVVTLSGDVPAPDAELAAVKIANGTAGVKSVTDQLKVNGTAVAGNSLPDAGTPQGGAPASAGNPPAGAPGSTAENPPPPVTPPPAAPTEAAEATPRQERRRAEVTIPAGSRVTVRTIDAIDSSRNQAGQSFRASLDQPLLAGDRVAVPAGEPVSVLLVTAQEAGRIRGSSELELRLGELSYHGRGYHLDSSTVTQAGKARGKQTAIRTGIGAAAGAVIGALAGGGKGAAIGSAAGGGAGLGYQIFTHGGQVKVPSESILTFQLQAPLTIQK
ncbi:MAG: BON domain-containing protein [Acidobacteriia bacterium]|nr:BON domain-containing protein [Terriglobia bacterium]